MRSWTFGELKQKVLTDLDMFEESFVGDDELVGFVNDAIEDAASEINRLGREMDFFLTKYAVPLVSGESEIALPEDIFVRDIRRLMYASGSNIYPVRRFRGQNKFEAIAFARNAAGSDDYRYFQEMDSDESQAKIILVPPARETSDSVMTMHYIRAPRYIPLIAGGDEDTTLATVIDIPEFIRFIFAHVKVAIIEKAKEPVETFIAKLQTQRQYLVDTLSGHQDDDDEIHPDLSHYMESN